VDYLFTLRTKHKTSVVIVPHCWRMRVWAARMAACISWNTAVDVSSAPA